MRCEIASATSTGKVVDSGARCQCAKARNIRAPAHCLHSGRFGRGSCSGQPHRVGLGLDSRASAAGGCVAVLARHGRCANTLPCARDCVDKHGGAGGVIIVVCDRESTERCSRDGRQSTPNRWDTSVMPGAWPPDHRVGLPSAVRATLSTSRGAWCQANRAPRGAHGPLHHKAGVPRQTTGRTTGAHGVSRNANGGLARRAWGTSQYEWRTARHAQSSSRFEQTTARCARGTARYERTTTPRAWDTEQRERTTSNGAGGTAR